MIMVTGRKLRVAVLYGGRSGEHEVSLQSAASVINNLDRERFEIVPIAVDKRGRWLLNDVKLIQQGAKSLPVFKDAPVVVLPPSSAEASAALLPVNPGQLTHPSPIDVVFPVMHGPLCEDGTIQGLLELADVPYVGCGVLASAVGMDKDVAKRLARDAGIPVVPWFTLRQAGYERIRETTHAAIGRELGFPNFVKPANMGSSVGVRKVRTAEELPAAIEEAFRYDTKVLVEKAVDAREIEVAVLEPLDPGQPPMTSIPGEVAPTHEFYSYEAKYLDENGAVLVIPADLDGRQAARVRQIAAGAFMALECEGLTRCDFFLDRMTGEFYFNEINTLPGFTQISMYPKLWEATGITYRQLLTHLIELAIARHQRRSTLLREYAQDREGRSQ